MGQLHVTPVVMSGGAGSRLWPLSRAMHPKQFHSLVEDRSMLAATIARVEGGDGQVVFDPYMILASANHAAVVRETVAPLSPAGSLVFEPAVRNTAAALAVAALLVAENNSKALALALPSDAYVRDVEAFRRAVAVGADAAGDGAIVTFGIVPTAPETGYGYIKRGASDGDAYLVDRFVEKPDAQTAIGYLETGDYYWNGGIFLFQAAAMIAELERQAPDILSGAHDALAHARRSGIEVHLDKARFSACRSESIDYAVMEGARLTKVVPVDMGWSDVGSWAQIYDVSDKDADGNVFAGNVVSAGARNSYVHGRGRPIGLVGVSDLVIVDSPDALLVAQRNASQDVKKVVEALKAAGRAETDVPAISLPPVRPGAAQVARVRSWMFDDALPFWLARGVDWKRGGVFETFDLAGNPRPDDIKRLRVLARQIYVFSHARLMGVDPSGAQGIDAALEHLISGLLNRGWHPDGGWIHLFHPDLTVASDTRDAYDQAFAMFALGWAYRATGRQDVLDAIDRSLAFMDTHLADTTHGGFRESLPDAMPRRANPHMHFLEAMLACWSATGNHDYLNRAEKIVRLFREKLFDPGTWTLTEFFNDDWSIAAGPSGQSSEPGHHYEWVWLLTKYQQHTGEDVSEHARKLFAHAEAFGRHPISNRIYDAVTKDGNSLQPTSRTWPQTEALKAMLVLQESGRSEMTHRVDQTLSTLLDSYLAPAPRGTWFDQYAGDGKMIAATIPTSTHYHVFSACAEFLRVYDDPEIAAL